jgi:hypothetical protein
MKSLQLAEPVSGHIAVHQTEPDSPSRIGRYFTGCRHRRRSEYLFYLKISNSDEFPWVSTDLRPNVVFCVLCDSHHESKRPAIRSSNLSEFPFL